MPDVYISNSRILTTQQKALALDALCGKELSICLDCKGQWFVSMPHVEVKCGSTLHSSTGEHCTTPEAAIEASFDFLTTLPDDKYIVFKAYGKEARRAYKWNGFMWNEIKENLDNGN
jgi:hypothetical protein